MKRSVSKSWRTIDDVLRENAHSVFRALRKPIADFQLRRLKNHFGSKFPKDFVQSLKIHDGLRNSFLGRNRLFNYWALLPASAIIAVSKAMVALQAECGFGGCQLEVTPRIKNDAYWRLGWVPLLDADGDKVIIDLDPGPGGIIGQVFEWSHSGGFPKRLLADSLNDWLSEIADRFSNRQFRLDKYGGIWLDTN